MTGIVSRVVVGVVGLPVVLGLVWVGGWWLFALAALAAVIAVHEFVMMARPLRPLAPAADLGVVLALVGAETGGVVWLVGGFLATFVFAFILNAVATTRAPATAAIGATVLCAAWVGLGLGHLLLLRGMHTQARLLAFTVLPSSQAGSRAGTSSRRRSRPERPGRGSSVAPSSRSSWRSWPSIPTATRT